MRIIIDEFLEIYKRSNLKKYINIFYSKPESIKNFYKYYLTSKLWRLNNIYTIVDKFGNRIPFVMNKAQHVVYALHLLYPRLIILKSRQQGISTLWLVSFFDDAITNTDLSIGLMAQGMDEASSLLERTKILWEALNPTIKNFLSITVEKDNIKEYKFSNNSKIYIRTSFRSQTLQRLHISEFGKIANKYPDKAKEVKTGTLQAIAPGNAAIIESTAEGDNIFKDEWEKAVSFVGERTLKDFYPIFLSWLQDPDCVEEIKQIPAIEDIKYFEKLKKEGISLTKEQENFWISKHRELGSSISQEYPTTDTEAFMLSKKGSYYAELYYKHVITKKRIIENLYDKNLPVQLATDLGHGTMVLLFYQYFDEEIRFFHEYKGHGQDLEHYVDYINKLGYEICNFVAPHDINRTSLSYGTTRVERLEELGITDLNILEKTGLLDGIEQVCKAIKNIWIDKSCTYIRRCFVDYSKEYDEKTRTWKKTPKKGPEEHGADTIRYAVLGLDEDAKFIRTEKQNVGKYDL